MKKTFYAVLCLCLLAGTACMAQSEYRFVPFDDGSGNVIEYLEVPELGFCYPIRSFCEAYGRAVDWDGATNTVYIGEKADFPATDTIKAAVDGKILDAPVTAYDGRTYLPLDVFGDIIDLWASENDAVRGVPADTVVVGTGAVYDDDVLYIDEDTGEYVETDPDVRNAAAQALAAVKEKLGVDLKFIRQEVQVTPRQRLLTGQYGCDLSVMWNGVQGYVLDENILQPVDPYMDVFTGDSAWLLQCETYGGHYLLNKDINFVSAWPLCYNIGLLDRIPALKEADGTTLYPGELYERGEWTWSRFEEYLQAIADSGLTPYETNYDYAAIGAMVSNGAAVFDGENMRADSPEAAEAADYLRNLADKGLLTCEDANKETGAIYGGWLNASYNFMDVLFGGSAFTNVSPWLMDDAGATMSMGIVPFPRSDSYGGSGILSIAGDSVGLMKGLSPERSRLALEAYALYKNEFYKALSGADSVQGYIDNYAAAEAKRLGLDTDNEEVGAVSVAVLRETAMTPVNDCSEAIGIFWKWSEAAGKYIFGFDGYDDYVLTITQSGLAGKGE